MDVRLRVLLVTVVLTLFVATNAEALTAREFVSICNSNAGECVENPLIQAYVGGALDVVAALAETTDYLPDLYCKPPGEFFDVPAIIRYVQEHAAGFSERNAMQLLIRYLEENGGC
jgi:hypothetical protein